MDRSNPQRVARRSLGFAPALRANTPQLGSRSRRMPASPRPQRPNESRHVFKLRALSVQSLTGFGVIAPGFQRIEIVEGGERERCFAVDPAAREHESDQ